MTRARWTALLILLLALPAMPVATSQVTVGETSVSMSLPNLGAPVKPGNPQNNSVTVTYIWDNGVTTEPTEVHLEVVDEPSWLNSSFHPDTFQVNNTTSSPNGNVAEIVTVTLDVDETAPAYAEASATYRVVAEENGMLPSAEATEEFPVTAGFRGTVDAHLPKGENVTAWGGLVTEVPIELTNNANGPLLVGVTVVRSPADAIVTPPLEVRVNATEGDRTVTTNLDVEVPWSVSLSGPVIVELSPTHAERGTAAKTIEAEFQLEGNSAVPVPGPGVSDLLVLAGVAAIALAARKRRA